MSTSKAHRQALYQVVDHFVGDMRGPAFKAQLVDEILRTHDRFNAAASPGETPCFEVSITKHGAEGPFWSKIVTTRKEADRVATKNQRLIDQNKWEHTITIKEVP